MWARWWLSLRRNAAAFVAFAIATGWLNQGATVAEWLRIEKHVAAGDASLVERARSLLAFAYRRSFDEELYYATANALRGLPYDEQALTGSRGPVPAEFRRAPKVDGRWHVPYREVGLEYAAWMLPFIVLPSFVAHDLASYARAFGALMGVCLFLSFWLCIRAGDAADRSVNDDASRRVRAWLLASALLLAEGGLAIQRLDAVVALALAVAVFAARRHNVALLGAAFGFATAAKFVPALFLPPVLVALRHQLRPPHSLARFTLGFSAMALLGLGPMMLMDSGSIGTVLRFHAARGLHVESALASLLSLARLAAGGAEPAILTFGSYNLTGRAADRLAFLSACLLPIGSIVLAARCARLPPTTNPHRSAALVLACSLAWSWLAGKVFSPQYLTWGLPLAVVLSQRSDRRLVAAFFGALLVSQIYMRGFYDYVYNQSAIGILTLLVRQALVAAFGIAAFAAESSIRRSGNVTASTAARNLSSASS